MMNETVVWYYKSNLNPWPNTSTNDLESIEWKKYRDLEIDLIEEAYQNDQPYVLLDRYRIDFQHFIQINLTDERKQRPIKREKGSNRIKSLRENRFGSSISSTSSSRSCDSFDAWCPFLKTWFDTPTGKRSYKDFSTCIEACAQGIIREAALHDSQSNAEANYMAKKLRECQGKKSIEVSKQCIHFYTMDNFLYFVLNKAIREEDHSKIETLGPLCYLIRNYSRLSKDYIGIVYRGVQLNYIEIGEYKQNINQWKTWTAYTSTSKDRSLAEVFGNTLFIIEITDIQLSASRAYDIEHLSQYPDEKEVLIPAGVSFLTIKVEQDSSQKYIIYIKT